MMLFIYVPKFNVSFVLSRLIATIVMLIFCTSAAIAASTSSPVHQVQGDIRAYLGAEYGGDVEIYINLTHPKGIEMDGGIDAFRLHRTNMARMMNALDLQLDVLAFPSPPQFFEGHGGRRFVIVPHLTTVSANTGRRSTAVDFELGVLEPGATSWKYIGGEIGKIGIQHFFPDFPPDVKLPPRLSSRKPKK